MTLYKAESNVSIGGRQLREEKKYPMYYTRDSTYIVSFNLCRKKKKKTSFEVDISHYCLVPATTWQTQMWAEAAQTQ